MSNHDWLQDKVALVTGAAGGLGLALARVLAREGAKVVLADIDGPRVREACEALSADGHRVLALELDVTEPAGWKRAASLTRQTFGEVDVLCNNAGIVGAYSLPMGVEPELLRRVFDVNVVGQLRGVQTFAPTMRERGRGHILNTGSMTGIDTVASAADYSAAKHAFVSLSEALRDELAGDGIVVSVLCPGGIATDFGARRPSQSRIAGNAVSPAGPAFPSAAGDAAKRGGVLTPAEVAELAVEGLSRGDFYIFTHPAGRERLQKRFNEMSAAFDRLMGI